MAAVACGSGETSPSGTDGTGGNDLSASGGTGGGRKGTGGEQGRGGGPGEVTPLCAKLKPLRFWETSPAAVATLFTAEDCSTGLPLTHLDESSFTVSEEGEPLSSEVYRAVLPGRGSTVIVTLLFDVSDATTEVRAELIAAAKSFAKTTVGDENLRGNIRLGISLFNGSEELFVSQEPTSDLDRLNLKLEELSNLDSSALGSSSLSEMFELGVEQTQTQVRQLMNYSLGGTAASGHLVVFTHAAGQQEAQSVSEAALLVSQARILSAPSVPNEDPAPVVQTWAVALQGEDAASLRELVGERWVREAAKVSELPSAFSEVGSSIVAQAKATYFFAYCSEKRSGRHTVTLGIQESVGPESQGFEFSFSAEGFGPGCGESYFADTCEQRECGGFACGACAADSACANATHTCQERCSDTAPCSKGPLRCEEGAHQSEQSVGLCESVCVNQEPCTVSQLVLETGRSCALRSDGRVSCWGSNHFGQLGIGPTKDWSATPEEVSGLTEVKSVAAYDAHTCALRGDGSVFCWGYNRSGQLGNGQTSEQYKPLPVGSLTEIWELAVGLEHSCGLHSDGGAFCWGRNNAGQLGQETWPSPSPPVRVSDLTDAVAVAVGYAHSCALRREGNVFCWGANLSGQLGDGTRTNRFVPVRVSGLTEVTALVLGRSFGCTLRKDGSVFCWGENATGQLGDGTRTERLVPVQVSGLTEVTALSASGYHSCALQRSGLLSCWGSNIAGQLGDGTKTERLIPVQVNGLTEIENFSMSSTHNCALRKDGGVFCWGLNSSGQLGDGTIMERTEPVQVLW